MKIFKLIACCLIVFLFPSGAIAGGMAVTDTISHMYESKEITKLVEQIELATKQLEMVQQYTDTFQNAFDKAHANYNKAKQVADNITTIRDYYDKTKSTLLGRYSQIMDLYGSLSDTDFKKLADLLDDTFQDPRDMTWEQWAKVMDRQFDIRQLGLKALIDSNEDTLNSMKGKVAHMKDLASQSDATASPKEAQDITNALLLEILQVLHEMLGMDAKYQQVMASQQYKGVTEESIKARQQTIVTLEEWESEEKWERKELSKYGLSKDSTLSDIRSNERKPTLNDIIYWKN